MNLTVKKDTQPLYTTTCLPYVFGWQQINGQQIKNAIRCPYCNGVFEAYKCNLNTNGKVCSTCGALHKRGRAYAKVKQHV